CARRAANWRGLLGVTTAIVAASCPTAGGAKVTVTSRLCPAVRVMGWLLVVGFRLKPFPSAARHTASRLGFGCPVVGSTRSWPVFLTVKVSVPVDPGATA